MINLSYNHNFHLYQKCWNDERGTCRKNYHYWNALSRKANLPELANEQRKPFKCFLFYQMNCHPKIVSCIKEFILKLYFRFNPFFALVFGCILYFAFGNHTFSLWRMLKNALIVQQFMSLYARLGRVSASCKKSLEEEQSASELFAKKFFFSKETTWPNKFKWTGPGEELLGVANCQIVKNTMRRAKRDRVNAKCCLFLQQSVRICLLINSGEFWLTNR